jgi:ribonuclease G
MSNETDSTPQTPQDSKSESASVKTAAPSAAPEAAPRPRLERVLDASSAAAERAQQPAPAPAPSPAPAPVAPPPAAPAAAAPAPAPAAAAASAAPAAAANGVAHGESGSDADDGEDDGPEDAPQGASGSEATAAPGAPESASAPGAPGAQGRQPGEGGGRRRRRRRRGRGGRNREGAAPGQPGAPAQARPDAGTGAPSASATPPPAAEPSAAASEAPAAPAPAQRQEPRRDDERRGERGREQGRRDERRGGRDERRERREERSGRGERGGREERHGRDERHGHLGERTNEVRGARPAVKREVLANTSFEETRIAILENGRLAELHWERKSAQNIVGNIYKGTVENVLPGISSAFVNIGFEKNAYLYISDVLGEKGAAIDSTLKKGQTIMVQVAKEAISTKGPKVTMDVTLPGRTLVFTPFQKDIGISKHIAEPEERQRLEGIVTRLVSGVLGGRGVVVRTEAEGASEAELEHEVKYLLEAWQKIEKKFAETPAPTILHQDLSLALQIARDVMSDQVYVYLIDNKEAHKEVTDFVEGFAPELKDRIRLYESKTPIFKAHNLEKEILSIRETKVPLPNGGSIVIQEAESLCAIDVNTGRFTGSKSQEETVTQTNIEAAQMVAQQLRLRNIGGIIVVDFIDMRKASNRQKVTEAFAEACRADRAKIRILPITRLGLIELTRERKRMSTAALLTADCPQCRASGRVLSAETLRIRIQREIFELTGGRPGGSIRVMLHPPVAESFRSQQALIEKNVQRSIKVQADPTLSWEDYRIILE